MQRNHMFLLIGWAVLFTFTIILNVIFDDEQTVQQNETNQVSQTESTKDNQPGEEDNQNDTESKQDANNDQEKSNNNNNNQEESNSDSSSQNKDEANKDTEEIMWGVDSASYTDENLYQCITENFGKPSIYGRYLGDIEGVSAALDQNEVEFLHGEDIKILVIYNHISDATGYEHGVDHAEQAIAMADELGVPEGVALFGDIEPSFPVDSEFIQGWYDTITESKYSVGLYGVFDEESELLASYNEASEEAQENTIVWTAYPQEEITSKENAPEFNPQGPENAMLYGWQYAIDAETCNIDTNLFKGEIVEYLW